MRKKTDIEKLEGLILWASGFIAGRDEGSAAIFEKRSLALLKKISRRRLR